MRSKHGTPNLIAHDMDRSVSQGARTLADVDRHMLSSCLRLPHYKEEHDLSFCGP
jgi:hypothetical protein